MYNSVRKLFGLFLLLLLVSESLQSQTKVINVNIYGGVNPYNNVQWNNWNVGTKTAPLGFTNLKYSTGELTGFNISWNVVHEAVVDNSATYGGGVFPAEALRHAMYTTSSTFNITGTPGFTISGLDNNKIYDFEFVGSRNNAGQTSYYQARGITTKESSNLSTYLNKDNSVFIQNISPVNGTITLRWARPNLGTFAYLNMFRIYEKPDCRTYSTQNFSLKPNQFPFSFRSKTYAQPGVYKDTLMNAAGCDSIISLNLFLLPEFNYGNVTSIMANTDITPIEINSTGSSLFGSYAKVSIVNTPSGSKNRRDQFGNTYKVSGANIVRVSPNGGETIISPKPVTADEWVVDNMGNIYGEFDYHKLFRVDFQGNRTILIGCGEYDSRSGIGEEVCFYGISQLTIDESGNLYYFDFNTYYRIEQGFRSVPELPLGLRFDSIGRIVGKALFAKPFTMYTIIGQNFYGYDTAVVGFEVVCNPDVFEPLSDSLVSISLKPNQYPYIFNNKNYTGPGVYRDTLRNNIACPRVIVLSINTVPEFSYPTSSNQYFINQPIPKITPTQTGSLLNGVYGRKSSSEKGNYIDKNGTIFGVSGSMVFKIPANGIKVEFAGGVTYGYLDANGNNARFYLPEDITDDENGNLYVADLFNRVIRKIDSFNNVTTFSGTRAIGSRDGLRETATYFHPSAIVKDAAGNFIIADPRNYKIRKVNKDGTVITIAGTGMPGTEDGSLFNATLLQPRDVTISPSGDVYFVDYPAKIRKISQAGIVSTVLNFSEPTDFTLSDGTTITFWRPNKLEVDAAGNLFVSCEDLQGVLKINKNGVVEAFTSSAGFGVFLDKMGNVFSDTNKFERGFKVEPQLPMGLAIDSTGSIYGTPLVSSPITTYTVIGENFYGSDTAYITFGITTNCGQVPKQGVKRISIKPTDFPFSYNGKTYNVPGDYRDTLLTATGCDSIHILKLQLLPDVNYNSSYTVYAGQSVANIVPQSLGSNVNGLKGRITKVADSTVFWHPRDSFGNYYYINGGSIFKNTPSGTATLFCNVIAPYNQDLNDIAIDDSNYVYVTSTYAGCVLRISPTGNQEIYAGGVGNLVPKEGYRTQVALDYASGLHFGDNGELYVGAWEGRSISVIDRNGWVKVVCDYTGLYPFGSPVRPNRLDLDGSGNVYFNDAAYYYLLELGITNNLNWYTGCKDLFEGENDSCAVNGNELKVDTAGFIYVKTPNATKRIEMGFSISPQLPNGLKIDSLGKIVGIPNAISPLTTYQVIAQNYYGSDTTSFQLEVAANCAAVFDPLPDTLSSCLDSISLDAGAGYQSRLWSNGDTSRISIIRQSGPVSIRVTTNTGCIYSDTVMVEIFNPRIAQQDTTVLAGTNIQLNMLLPKTGSMQDAEGRIYKTTTIGSRTWMAENLSVSRYQNGDIIPYKPDPVDWANTTTGAWCWYNNDSATYASLYGKLYNGYAITDPRGLAPIGWHLSTNPEWDLAADELGGGNIAGGKMKSLIDWNAPNTGATNSSGFNGKPSGARDGQNGFMNALNYGYWWTSTAPFVFRSLSTYNTQIFGDNSGPKVGKSVRLVSDKLVGEGIRYLWSTGDTTSSITVSPTVTTKYKVIITNGRITCTDSVEIKVASLANAGTITGDSSKCMINELVLNSSGAQGTIQWQISGDSISFSNIGTANNSTLTFQTSLLTEFNKYYYFRIVSVLGDSKDTSEVHKVYIERLLNPISVHASEYQPVCPGTGGLTMYNYEGGSIQWYSKTNIDSAFRLVPGVTTTTYLAGPAVTTYYQAVVTPRVCPSVSTTAGIEVAVRPQPPTAADVTRCGPGIVELVATNTTSSVVWADSLGNVLQDSDESGNVHFITPVLDQTKTYQVMNRSTDAFGRGCRYSENVISDPTIVKAIIIQNLNAGVISGDTVFCTSSPIVLTVNGAFGNIQWQEMNFNGQFVDIPNETGNTLTMIKEMNPTSGKTFFYRVKVSSINCGITFGDPFKIIVESPDTQWEIQTEREGENSNLVCKGDSRGLYIAFAEDRNTNVLWYSSDNGIEFSTTPVGQGYVYYTEGLFANKWFKASMTYKACSAVSKVFGFEVLSDSEPPIVSDISNCGPATFTLSATPSSGAFLVWYDSLGVMLQENEIQDHVFTTSFQSVTTKYQVSSQKKIVWSAGSAQYCPPSEKSTIYAIVNQLPDTSLVLLDPPVICSNGGTVRMKLLPGNTNRWFKNGQLLFATLETEFVASSPGSYYAIIQSPGNCIDTTRIVDVVAVSPANPGILTGANTVCTGTNSTLLNVTGASGSLQWQRSADNLIFTDISGATGTSYTATNLTVTTYYRVAARTGSCDPVYSASIAVTVGNGATSGVVSGATTVCSGTNSAVVTVTGNIGTIQWQSSTNNSTWTNITGATANSYTAINLTSTRYYRVVITNGTCGTATSSSVRILVNARSVAGTISGAGNVCAGINNQTLTLSGYTGSIQWQSSTDSLSFTNISGATSSTYTPLNLTATRYYRAVVTSGICPPATTAVATIRVSAGSIAAGTIAGATTVCTGINSTTLVLSGNIGTIQWQSSSNNTTWSNITGATLNTYTVNNITGTRYYRVRVSSSCGSVTSSSVTMRVNAVSVAGTISGAGSVCWGTNSRTLTLAGYTGSIQWQISTDNSVFTNISGATAATYTATNLTATRYYRVVVKSGVCNAVNSTAVAIVVDPISVAGTISGNLPVCAGTNSSLLTLSGYTGTIQWQSSTNNSTFTSIAGATTATYNATNLTTSTYYRAVVKSGSCVSVNSGSVMIQVNPITSAECTTGSSNNGGNGGNKPKQIAVEESISEKMRLYPNPSERSVFVDAGKLPDGYYLIRVLDLTGRELFRTTSGKRITEIDWGNLTAGTYMIEVREGVHSQILKAIKL